MTICSATSCTVTKPPTVDFDNLSHCRADTCNLNFILSYFALRTEQHKEVKLNYISSIVPGGSIFVGMELTPRVIVVL